MARSVYSGTNKPFDVVRQGRGKSPDYNFELRAPVLEGRCMLFPAISRIIAIPLMSFREHQSHHEAGFFEKHPGFLVSMLYNAIEYNPASEH